MLLIAAADMLCHTIAHAPYPLTASHIPATAPTASPAMLLTAIIFTSMRFIRRLVCTIAVALSINVRNMALDSGTSLMSPLNISAIGTAQNHSVTYMNTARAMLNHSTVL